MQSTKSCACTIADKDPSCTHGCKPFMEHSEMKVKPRMFMPVAVESDTDDNQSEEDDNMIPQKLVSSKNVTEYKPKTRMIDDMAFQQKNRTALRKFEALQIHGKDLTGLTIGGFEVDLNVAAQKAMEILPMPASKLPVIFIDEELNFLHHFFQGVTKTIGESQLQVITAKRRYYDDEHPIVIRMVEDLIREGYDKEDSEIITFLKKVITSTFNISMGGRRSRNLETVTVAANLWGFQYIECGMSMNEADLQMWLSMCYGQYRNSWFNTFKSSGVPEFARDGSGKARSLSSMSSGSYSDNKLETVIEADDASIRTSRSRSSKKGSSKQRHRRQSTNRQSESPLLRYLSGQ